MHGPVDVKPIFFYFLDGSQTPTGAHPVSYLDEHHRGLSREIRVKLR